MSNINFRYCIGDIFKFPADCYVNAVNCIGVMGAGIALQFKKYFYKAYKEYKSLCDQKLLETYSGGSLHKDSHVLVNSGNECYIYQFPTMYNPGEKASIETIKSGMLDLVETLMIHDDIKIISIPPLGCGIGRLDKKEVESVIRDEISKLNRDIIVNLFNF